VPARSKAQFKKMFLLFKQGKITRSELNEFTNGVDYRKLPARKTKKVARKKRGGGK
jgi:hypothetical protein